MLAPVHMRTQSWGRASVAAVIAAAVALLAVPALCWAGPSRFDLGFQDPLDPAFHDRDTAHAYSVAKAQKVHFIRINAPWFSIAPNKPTHGANFQDRNYHWADIDRRVRAIRRH